MFDKNYLNAIRKQIDDSLKFSEAYPGQLIDITQMNRQIFEQFDLSFFNTDVFRQAVDISNQISDLIKPVINWQEQLSDVISTLVVDLPIPAQLFTVDLAAFDLSAFILPTGEIFRNFLQVIEENEEISDAFKACGWPLAPSMLPILRERILQLHQQDKSHYSTNVIIGFYHRCDFENLDTMVESWRTHPLLSSRMHIIDDALEAHKARKYTLSVPALLSLVEGILNEYVIRNNLPARCGKIAEVYRAVIGDVNNYSLVTWAISRTLLYHLDNNTYTYTAFERELKRLPHNRLVSRHTVLHGVSTNYHKPSHSLKAFVLLDAISALHDEIE